MNNAIMYVGLILMCLGGCSYMDPISGFADEDLSSYRAHDTVINVVTPTLTSNGALYNAYLAMNEKDLYTFFALSDTTYTIQTQGSYVDTKLKLLAPNGTTLLMQDDDSGDGNNAKIVWLCTASGTYSIEVSGQLVSANGWYDIGITQ